MGHLHAACNQLLLEKLLLLLQPSYAGMTEDLSQHVPKNTASNIFPVYCPRIPQSHSQYIFWFTEFNEQTEHCSVLIRDHSSWFQNTQFVCSLPYRRAVSCFAQLSVAVFIPRPESSLT